MKGNRTLLQMALAELKVWNEYDREHSMPEDVRKETEEIISLIKEVLK